MYKKKPRTQAGATHQQAHRPHLVAGYHLIHLVLGHEEPGVGVRRGNLWFTTKRCIQIIWISRSSHNDGDVRDEPDLPYFAAKHVQDYLRVLVVVPRGHVVQVILGSVSGQPTVSHGPATFSGISDKNILVGLSGSSSRSSG